MDRGAFGDEPVEIRNADGFKDPAALLRIALGGKRGLRLAEVEGRRGGPVGAADVLPNVGGRKRHAEIGMVAVRRDNCNGPDAEGERVEHGVAVYKRYLHCRTTSYTTVGGLLSE